MMKFIKALRNKYIIAILSILTLGLFALGWVFYLIIKLKTLTYFSNTPKLAIVIPVVFACFLFSFWYLLIFLLIVTHLFIIPIKLEEEREYAGLEADISWKLGLLPTLTAFYTFGFMQFFATPKFMSKEIATLIGLPMMISTIIAVLIWIMKVHEKYIEHNDQKKILLAKLLENPNERKERKAQIPNLLELHQSEYQELPALELPNIETDKQEISPEMPE